MKRKAEDILTGFVQVRGFDFGAVYGDLGRGCIEVHHIRPLSALEEETEVDPERDLACLCSNCHRMIHRSRDHVMTPEELKERLRT